MNIHSALLKTGFDLNGSIKLPIDRNDLLFQLSKEWTALRKDVSALCFLFEDEFVAEDFYDDLFRSESIDAQVFFYPGLDSHPFSSIIESEDALFQRLNILSQLAGPSDRPIILVSSVNASTLKIPSRKLVQDLNLKIQTEQIISPYVLAGELTKMGYRSCESANQKGEFSHRGEIFDLRISDETYYRITYFDDSIESIVTVDPTTSRSNGKDRLDVINIPIHPYFILNDEYSLHFRNNVPQPSPRFSLRHEERKKVLDDVQSFQAPEHIGKYFPLFLPPDASTNLFEFIKEMKFRFIYVGNDDIINVREELESELDKTYQVESESIDSEILCAEVSKYISTNLIDNLSLLEVGSLYNQSDVDIDPLTVLKVNSIQNKSPLDFLVGALNEYPDSKEIFVCYQSQKTLEEIKYLIELANDRISVSSGRIQFLACSITTSFYKKNLSTLVLSDSDFFIHKKGPKAKSRKRAKGQGSDDFFAEQLATLKIGDYVVHATHGVGVFEGLQSLEQGDTKNDYVVLNYADGDKVYVPVYKLNSIQKYSSSESNTKVDSLRTNHFQQTKVKVRKSVKKLAFDLLKLQAERASKEAVSFSNQTHLYKEFELDFQFTETPDQESAIFDSIEDLAKSRPMDRLVCGDVGFGKTEVAMRAAFKVAEEGGQVAVLAPTTILALQHFNTFRERFKKFPINIEMISRLRSKKECLKIYADVKDQKIDILVGTHALLSEQIKFKNLGLLIIDEEHRFGVGQKEQIKRIRSDVHCLTLTATPIPRTLQMSFLGIKDFSLIKTPPPLKQSVKTILLKEDEVILKHAIDSELSRGGQVFVVHNRVQDIEIYAEKIRALSPMAKITIAHGQLPAREIEKRIMSFYKGEFNILLATTIIESGIDIPNANTMIIFNADNLGLAQLHQLRGRIGRSDRKAYAYLVIPKNKHLTNDSEQRLKALQLHSDLGSGFALASNDLEIRGSGDILGAEQSGHINEIGLELYLELLKEAMSEIKGEVQTKSMDFEIITPFDSQIPSFYIHDTSKRIAYYKKLSNTNSLDGLQFIRDELNDIYGPIPDSLDNLLKILGTRNILVDFGIISLKATHKEITISFDQELFSNNPALQQKLIDYFLAHQDQFKLMPGNKVKCFFKEQINPTSMLEFANNIAQQIIPC